MSVENKEECQGDGVTTQLIDLWKPDIEEGINAENKKLKTSIEEPLVIKETTRSFGVWFSSQGFQTSSYYLFSFIIIPKEEIGRSSQATQGRGHMEDRRHQRD